MKVTKYECLFWVTSVLSIYKDIEKERCRFGYFLKYVSQKMEDSMGAWKWKW